MTEVDKMAKKILLFYIVNFTLLFNYSNFLFQSLQSAIKFDKEQYFSFYFIHFPGNIWSC